MIIDYFLFALLSFGVSLLIGNPLIKLLKSVNVKQTVREDGPPNHLKKKSKTPTVGGLIFLIPLFLIISAVYFLKKDFQTLDLKIVLGTTFIMAVLGFIDDYLKVLKKHNKGVSGWLKLLIQFVVSLVIARIYNEGIFLISILWIFFVISGSTNSYNLTDGLDGLLTSVSLGSFLGFFILLSHQNKPELTLFTAIFFSSLVAFLYFNKHPAKVFMGDTGSLAIGGAIGSLAIVSRSELYLACFATIPIIEALSVIIQVASYQITKRFSTRGKRIFKMAPIHHHFELCGWKESEIVKRFFVFQVICVIVGILLVSFP